MTDTIAVERPGGAVAPDAAHDVRRTRRRSGDLLFRLALQACLVVAVAFLVSLLGYVLARGWGRLDWALVANMPSGLASRADTSGLQ